MNLLPYLAIWAILAVWVLALGAYRIMVARRDDSTLDVLESNDRVIAQQKMAIQKIGAIDRWGKSLTVVTVLYGLAIAAVYIAHLWQESAKIQTP